MPLSFGPQLIGQTEKSLNALLVRILDGRLVEPEWVTLRLAFQLDDVATDRDELVARVADRARLPDAADLVDGLTARGLLTNGRPTPAARALVAEVQAGVAEATRPIWAGLPEQDVDAAARVLNLVLERTRAVLDSG